MVSMNVFAMLFPVWAVGTARGVTATKTASVHDHARALAALLATEQNTKTSVSSSNHIHILPPSPDETLRPCDDHAAIYSACGADRYCAPLPKSRTRRYNNNHHQLQPHQPEWYEPVHALYNDSTPTQIPSAGTSQGDDNDDSDLYTNNNYYCLHKTLWGGPTQFPDSRDMLALFLTFGCCLLAAMAGIGGGGLILPVLMLVTNFTPKEGSVLSNTAVFCNATGQFIVNSCCTGTRRANNNNNNNNSDNANHSNSHNNNRPRRTTTNSLVVPATVLMIMPGLIAGGSVAITLEGLVPSTVILVLALLTLLLASAKTYGKARSMRIKELLLLRQEASTHILESRPEISSYSEEEEEEEENQVGNNNYGHAPAAASRPDSTVDIEHDALKASALEWGNPACDGLVAGGPWAAGADSLLLSPSGDHGRSPHRRKKKTLSPQRQRPQQLIDLNNEQNSPLLQEPFFGSIRFLAQPTPPNINGGDDNDVPHQDSVSIIDESSWITVQPSTSFDSNDSDNNNHDRRVNRRANTPCCGLQWVGQCCCCVFGRVCTYCANHIIQVLVGLCWIFDATTYLVLHSGKLRQCSPGFFAVMALPAVFAVVFVGLGRQRLNKWLERRRRQRYRRQQHATPSSSAFPWFPPQMTDNQGYQPLMSLFGSPSQDSDADDNSGSEEMDDPVPSFETAQTSPQPDAIRPSQWVLLVPLVSVLAGLIKAFQDSPARNDQGDFLTTNTISTDAVDNEELNLSVPLLSENTENTTTHVQANQHPAYPSGGQEAEVPITTEMMDQEEANIASLLVWWLPLASVLVGLFAALLGIGGGELLGPILLLLLQMDPQDSSATTAIMSMMNSGQNLLHACLADLVVAPGYAIHLGFAGMIGGSCGRLLAMDIAQRGRSSVIAMSLCGVLSLATALVAWELFTTPVSWKRNAGIC